MQFPNGEVAKFLNDSETYLGNQLKYKHDSNVYYGIVANMNFFLVCKYDKNGNNAEIILYKKR